MTISRQQLFKNTSIMMIAQVISWVLSLVLTLYLPRYFGVSGIGKYQLASSLWIIINIFATFGMDTYLTREIAQDRSNINELFSQVIVLKLIFFVIGAAGLAVYVSIVHYPADTVIMIMIIGISTFINLFGAGVGAVIQGLERIEYLALAGILLSSVVTISCMIAIIARAPIVTVVWMLCIGAVTSLVYYLRVFFHLHQFRFTFSLRGIKSLLLVSFSFFLLQIFINLYNQIDVIVISWFISENGIGWYGVAARLTGTLMFIPSVFMTVFFPTFSRLHHELPEELTKLFRKAFNLMFLLGVGVGSGIFVVAGPIVSLIYGPEFARSAPILSLRGIVSIFTFLNILIGMYLMSH